MRHRLSQRTGRLVVCAIAVALSAGLAGCGADSDKLLAVEGQVKFAGKPLTKGSVVFSPDASKGNTSNHEPRGSIEADGRYKMITHPKEGAPPGWYKVGVIATESKDPKNPYALPTSLIPEKFGKPDESGLRVEVRKDAPPGSYDLELK
jgi:hypothetical protein